MKVAHTSNGQAYIPYTWMPSGDTDTAADVSLTTGPCYFPTAN